MAGTAAHHRLYDGTTHNHRIRAVLTWHLAKKQEKRITQEVHKEKWRKDAGCYTEIQEAGNLDEGAKSDDVFTIVNK